MQSCQLFLCCAVHTKMSVYAQAVLSILNDYLAREPKCSSHGNFNVMKFVAKSRVKSG